MGFVGDLAAREMWCRWVTLTGVVVGISGVVLVSRMWKSRHCADFQDATFAARYAAVLGKQDELPGEQPDEDAKVLVLYGSTSGNAEGYAKSLVADLKDRSVAAARVDPSSWGYLDQCKLQPYHQQRLFTSGAKGGSPILVFVVSTTGEGELPANFICLYSEMQSVLEEASRSGTKPFEGLMYAVFALGDSSYKYYCRGGVQVRQLLKTGGGTEILPAGFGDARNPLQDDVFDAWEEALMEALEEQCGVTLTAGSNVPPEPQLVFRFTPDKPFSALPYPSPLSLLEPSMQYPAQFKVEAKTSRSKRREDGSYILHLVVNIEGYTTSYQAGDHLGIYPINPPDVVEAYRRLLKITEEDWVKPVELCTDANVRARASLKNSFPARVALGTVFERYFDLCSRPRKSLLRVLASYCSDSEEKSRLMELLHRGVRANGEDGAQNIPASLPTPSLTFASTSASSFSPHYRTVLDYLKMFPSCCCIPLGHLLELMPRMQPRFYSIASDMLTHPTTVEAFVRVIPDGLNSRYLERIAVGEKITAFIRKSTFHLPVKCGGRPILMIGVGTGIAPMVGFCYRREALLKKQPSVACGPMILFFGAQRRATEYFVKLELERWCLHGEGKIRAADVPPPSLVHLLDLAFSRDQPEKYHVTHLIEKHKEYLAQLLTLTAKDGCLVYLSGDAAHVAQSVDQALVKLLQGTGMTRRAAAEFLEKMEQERRYMKDVY
ncbi:NADPH cytochrome P450 reductase B [Trypanosoma rangeli]|uniref:NADPH cytochrome P450 reductase B n=1 Tax=Trypanosoma rangeli TaxID=5698 RepID=A0A3R7K908_TRYRA|nr:NADPH cytochrome P450 reductase B [Trypanosoma rangeli]RNF03679.1 NADPH cytochrome P450 reductase B [Trypanosoma rangeli]|eukprot:RNF03679.1 NADPH cytochrome P450 reductase B [Trypanosoma rangeli]